jgi:hypothetical protein
MSTLSELPQAEPEPEHHQRQEHKARGGVESGDEGIEHRIEDTRAANQHAERQPDDDGETKADRKA